MGAPSGKHVVHTYKTEGKVATENPWLALAQAIVYQAVLDWKSIDAGRSVQGENHATLRSFFLSPWCDTLLLLTGLDPHKVVEKLEADTRKEERP